MRTGRSKRNEKAKRKAFEETTEAFLAKKKALDTGDEIEAERQAKIEAKWKAKFEASKRRFNRQKQTEKRPVIVEIRRSRKTKRHPPEK